MKGGTIPRLGDHTTLRRGLRTVKTLTIVHVKLIYISEDTKPGQRAAQDRHSNGVVLNISWAIVVEYILITIVA